jgi:hypothetical protein
VLSPGSPAVKLSPDPKRGFGNARIITQNFKKVKERK